MSDSLPELLRRSPYQGYAYAYPHKTAYRRLDPPRALSDVWRDESRKSLFLYVHIPYCEMRCGFCNLFTHSQTRTGIPAEMESAYIDGLTRHAEIVRGALQESQFSGGAIGGGTPTFLTPPALEKVCGIFKSFFKSGLAPSISVEASPFTATPERLAILRAHSVTRLSLGVQSFKTNEVAAAGRAQVGDELQRALRNIKDAGFPLLNIDLIYGLPEQTVETWLESVREALRWEPEELYLYPLYVRPLTGLGLRNESRTGDDAEWNALRLNCYRAARTLLQEHGYRAQSMRHFRRADLPAGNNDYCCQEDGTVALGCGGRSYTRALHYSNEYAVSGAGVREIVERFVNASESDLARISYGFELDDHEQRRRYVIKSLLRADGLHLKAYESFFGSDAIGDIPTLNELIELRLARVHGDALRPTELGLEYSDVVGPWLASAAVRERMQAYTLR